MKDEKVSEKFYEMSVNLARHNLEVSLKNTKEGCFRAAKEIGSESYEGFQKMDDFVRTQYADEPKKIAEWNMIMLKYQPPEKEPDLNPFKLLNRILKEIQRIDKENPTGPDEATDPRIIKLLDMGNQLVKGMDPVIREQYRDNPQLLAEWDSIMQPFYAAEKEDSGKSET